MGAGRPPPGYEALAAEYDEHWVYRPDYVPWMSARIADRPCCGRPGEDGLLAARRLAAAADSRRPGVEQ